MNSVLEKNDLLKKLHKLKDVPRVEIGSYGHSTLTNYLHDFSQNGNMATYVIRDGIIETHSYGTAESFDDYDLELLIFESSVLEELADEVLKSESHEATIACDATYLRHKEWHDFYGNHKGDPADKSSAHTGGPRETSVIPVTLTLKIEDEEPVLSVDYDKK
jgi:hypothetical protein